MIKDHNEIEQTPNHDPAGYSAGVGTLKGKIHSL